MSFLSFLSFLSLSMIFRKMHPWLVVLLKRSPTGHAPSTKGTTRLLPDTHSRSSVRELSGDCTQPMSRSSYSGSTLSRTLHQSAQLPGSYYLGWCCPFTTSFCLRAFIPLKSFQSAFSSATVPSGPGYSFPRSPISVSSGPKFLRSDLLARILLHFYPFTTGLGAPHCICITSVWIVIVVVVMSWSVHNKGNKNMRYIT